MPGDVLVLAEQVGKRFGHRPGVEAVAGVSLTVARGEVCAIVGANGAGKSTLLALVLGFLKPTGGTITLDGEAPRDRHRAGGIAYLPERFALPDRWTVRQALDGFAALERVSDRRAAVTDALDLWGLHDVATRMMRELSRGTLQRVGLAQAWLAPVDLLVLDEPTEGLDPLWRLRLRDRIAARRDAGAAVLVASHDLAEIERVADRVLVLERGRVREELAARPLPGAGAYRITVLQGDAAVTAAFPDARADRNGWYVQVADAHELSARLAALLAAGGVVAGVQPVPLEERIRDAYEVPQ